MAGFLLNRPFWCQRSTGTSFIELWVQFWFLFIMPRQARIDASGALQHIITRGIERRAIFKNDTDRDDFINRLGNFHKEPALLIKYNVQTMENLSERWTRNSTALLCKCASVERNNLRHICHGILRKSRYSFFQQNIPRCSCPLQIACQRNTNYGRYFALIKRISLYHEYWTSKARTGS